MRLRAVQAALQKTQYLVQTWVLFALVPVLRKKIVGAFPVEPCEVLWPGISLTADCAKPEPMRENPDLDQDSATESYRCAVTVASDRSLLAE